MLKVLPHTGTWRNSWMWDRAFHVDNNYRLGLHLTLNRLLVCYGGCAVKFMAFMCVCLRALDGWMSMEQWWNDTDRGKLKYWEKNIIQRGWWMDEWVWSNGGMILTGENWSTGRKTLYSVGGRWMNEYGATVEWYWQGKLKCWEKSIIQRGW